MRNEYATGGPILGRIIRTLSESDADGRWYRGYADPVADDGRPVVSADWNRTPDKLVSILERRYGVHVEWCDEVTSCSDCGGAIRTEPDSHWWRPRFAHGDGEFVCEACLERAGLRYDDRERWPEILDPARLCSVGVSADTLDPMDLIPRFVDALKDAGRGVLFDREWSELEEVERGPRQSEPDPDAWRADALEWLFDRLGECAPDGYAFGAHESDGACFGFWPVEGDA